MSTENLQAKEIVEPGQVWFHQGRESEPYIILELLPNATGYERTGKIGSPIVVYEQGYDGQYPKGSRWARKLNDFLGTTEVDGKLVNNFVRKELK